MSKFLEIINILKDLSKNIKINKEKCIGNYNHNGINVECNVSIPSNDLDYVNGNIKIDGIEYIFHSLNYIYTFCYDCKFEYHSNSDVCRFLPEAAEIELPNGYGIDFTYFFQVDTNNMDIIFHGFEYNDLNFEPLRLNLNDWDDDYMFYLKLQGVIQRN